MKNRLTWYFLLFFVFIGIISSLAGFVSLEYGDNDYWDFHGVFFLIFITIFPRLTLLFSSVPFGGLFWWIGFLFAPRLLVAVLATITYWNENKVLVIISWLVAMSGESSEKYVIHRKTYRFAGDARRAQRENAIEVDYTIRDE